MSSIADVFSLGKQNRVLITAGASGIGRAIADLLIDCGARVHICDVDDAHLDDFKRTHPMHGATKADVSNESDVDQLFDEAKHQLGGLDALINNAGIAGPTGKVEELDPMEWKRTLDICLTGQFLCSRRAVPLIKVAGGDRS